MRKIVFLLFVLLNSYAYSQGNLVLKVVEEDKTPIEFANFRLFSVQDSSVVKGEYSDENGAIKISHIPLGNYYGIISFFGFDDKVVNELNFSATKLRINLGEVVLIKDKSQTLEEVVVMGNETKLMERDIDKRTYNVEEDMTSQGGTLVDVLGNVPSIDVDNDGNVSLRGNSGVTILIDGRKSALTSGDDLALDGIPASAVERIEIVTNPSAKYNPEGTAGIINIVLKKQKLRGVNLNVQASIASQEAYNAGLNFNYRTEKVNIFASYSYANQLGTRKSFNDRQSVYNDTIESMIQDNIGSFQRISHTMNLGTDFFIRENQTLGVSVSGSLNNRNRNGNQYNTLNYNDILNRYWNHIDDSKMSRKSVDLSANYKLDFKEQKGNLIIDANGSIGGHHSTNQYEEFFFFTDGSIYSNNPYNYENQNLSSNNERFTLKADLTRKVNEKIGYETGVEYSFRHQLRDNFLNSFDSTLNEIIPNLEENNIFDFSEHLISAYGIFNHTVSSIFKYQVGLRLEEALTRPYLITTGESFRKDYFSYFPSVHLILGNEKTGEFFMSFSRRINRPSMWQLNPFAMRTDPLNLRKGNPDLNPEYINSYELGYEKDVGKKLNLTATVYFRETRNKIQRVRLFYDNGLSISTFANIDRSYDYGLEIIGVYAPFSWWRNMISANVYESRMNAELNGTDLSNKGVSWDVKLNSTFTFWDNSMAIQLNAQYVAPRYTVQGIFQFNPGVDLGVTKKLLNNNLVIGARVSDIFNQKGFRMEITDRNITQKSTFKWTTRRLYLTLSYKFGNLKTKEDKRIPPNGGMGGEDMMD